MARYVRSNPRVFGEDVVDSAWLAIGVATTGVVNDKMVAPLTAQIVPASLRDETAGKVLDGVTTMVSGVGLGMVSGLINRGVARQLTKGGVILGVAKWLSIVLPGFSLTGTLPGAVSGRFPSFAPRAATPAALPSPVAPILSSTPLITAGALGWGSTGL